MLLDVVPKTMIDWQAEAVLDGEPAYSLLGHIYDAQAEEALTAFFNSGNVEDFMTALMMANGKDIN